MLSNFSFSKDTLGFIIQGKVDEASIRELQGRVLEMLETYEKINLYLEDDGIESFTLPAVIDEILFKIEHGDRFNKVALVTDRKWIKMCGHIENILIPATVKNFDVSERLKAIEWVAVK